jgi:lipopolysaccharide export system protein LptC
MANIDVQKKKTNPLPWIILVLLILALVGYFVWRNMNTPAGTVTNNADTTKVITDTTRQ